MREPRFATRTMREPRFAARTKNNFTGSRREPWFAHFSNVLISHKNICTIIFQLLSFLMVKKVSFLNTSACLAVHDFSLKAFFSGKI